jgi:phage shock protein PspC (stress-responsive transcriptional regulator)
MNFIDKILVYFESQAFGVCTKLGEKLKMSTSGIRLFFIYASFLTFGSPLIVYLGLAFIINIRKHLRRGRNTVWYC